MNSQSSRYVFPLFVATSLIREVATMSSSV